MRRRVYVLNPCSSVDSTVTEFLCDDGFCSVGGLCYRTIDFSDETNAAPNSPPSVTLVGPALAEITQGDLYTACSRDAHMAEVCDRGAEAVDVEDGVW